MDSIFKRVSVRRFQDRPIEDEKTERILRAAMAAPCAGNQQPWEFYVVTDKRILEKLSQTSPYSGSVKAAPLAIVTCYRREGLRYPEFALIDLAACCENILLEAVELGLSAVWLAVAPLTERIEKVTETLQLPANLIPFAIIPCGYQEGEKLPKNKYDSSRIHYI